MPIKYTTKWNREDIDEIIDVRTKEAYAEENSKSAVTLPVIRQEEKDTKGKK